jgi:hypothetical protein
VRVRTVVLASAIAGAGALAYSRVVRPWMATWGANDGELTAVLPGDDLLRGDAPRMTRAITIAAPVDEVWRWLVQIGEDGAGFYSYSWLERLALTDMHNADHIEPAWQERARGDTIWLAQRYGDLGRQVAAVLEPQRALVMVGPRDFDAIEHGDKAAGSWGFFLQPIDDEHTRLIVRSSGGPVGTPLFDVIHFVMEQKMMRGIKERAERAER